MLAHTFFSGQFIKIKSHNKKIDYNTIVLQQTACLAVTLWVFLFFGYFEQCSDKQNLVEKRIIRYFLKHLPHDLLCLIGC